MHSKGILWKKQEGGKLVEFDKADIVAVTWMKIPRTNQLGIRLREGLLYKFTGFRDQDLPNMVDFFQCNCGVTVEEKQLSVSGRNWGEVELNGNMLTFMIGAKQVFEVSLAEVWQAQLLGKTDVLLQFHGDDRVGANEKDTLMDMSFHIPSDNTQVIGDQNRTPAQVLRDSIMEKADGNKGTTELVVTFDGISILTPSCLQLCKF
ncbi:FACT complex subunit SSRP1 [Euphorbia peplus]|nr:FACT complex subunit SSRP1 [Euphorbia peplus]